MSSTDTLDLSLSDEEIENMHRRESGNFHPYDCCDPKDRKAIANAATAKAAWVIHDWLFDALYYQDRLGEILTAADIQKPE